MSLSVKTTLWCDTCNKRQIYDVFTRDNRVSINRVRRLAKKDGWSVKMVDKNKNDVCPDCREK